MKKLQEDLHPADLWDRLPGLIEDIMPKKLLEKTNAGENRRGKRERERDRSRRGLR